MKEAWSEFKNDWVDLTFIQKIANIFLGIELVFDVHFNSCCFVFWYHTGNDMFSTIDFSCHSNYFGVPVS